ncbi:MAG: choice-of-anchor Q domain-containing protein [Chloroflexota bacterium]
MKFTSLKFNLAYLFFPLLIFATIVLTASNIPNLVAQPDASIHYVATTGSDSGSCGTQAQPCQTIQQAISNSSNGDTILVAAGTYTRTPGIGNCLGGTAVVCISGAHRTIIGGYTTSNWTASDPTTNVTIIDGQNAHRGVQVHGLSADVASLVLDGFTIQNGRYQGASSGDDGDTFAFGGGMLADRGSVEARNLIVKDNSAVGGSTSSDYGGAAAGGGLAFRANTNGVTLENITFEDNVVQGGSGNNRGGFAIGGGLYTFQVEITGNNLTFTSNDALAGSSNGTGVSGNNNSDAQGGGAAFQVDTVANFTNITFTENQAIGGDTPNGDAGGSFGGGFFAELADVTMSDIYVAENLSEGGDGNNPNAGSALGDGGGIAATRSNLTLDRAVIVDNVASGGNGTVRAGAGGGGGIYYADFTETTTMRLTNVIIGNNLSEMGDTGSTPGGGGGGIFVNWGNVVMDHVTIAENRLGGSPMQGIGMVIINGAEVTISNSIFADLTDFASATAIHAQPGNSVTLDNNLFFNNNFDTGGGGTFTGEGTSFTGDPMFVSPGAPDNNYRINSGSAAIDQAAGSTVTTDVDNQSRSISGAPDVGADEYNPIILSIVPSNEALGVNWVGDTNLLLSLDHYEVVVSQGGSANPPNEGPSPIDVGTDTSIALTGLSNDQTYTIYIEAKDGANTVLGTSNTIQIAPTDDIVYLPVILR